MIAKGLGPEWKPERAKFALFVTNDGRRLTAHVDPGLPSAWRRAPYYENFKKWAREGIARTPDMHLVDVMIGDRCIVVLPDRDVDLGPMSENETVTLVRTNTANGMRVEVQRVAGDNAIPLAPAAGPEKQPTAMAAESADA
jgi:hypothetical protein